MVAHYHGQTWNAAEPARGVERNEVHESLQFTMKKPLHMRDFRGSKTTLARELLPEDSANYWPIARRTRRVC